jgi:L-seryl-tRNA(Ser) seleniumtransferase
MVEDLPLWSLALTSAEQLQSRAEAIAERVTSDDLKVQAIPTVSVAGGGSLPGEELGSWGVALAHAEKSVDEMQSLLRSSSPPVIGRIEDERLVLDLRSVFPEDVDKLIAIVRALG